MESSSDLNRQLLGTLGSGYYHRPCIQRFACISAIAIAVGVFLLFLVLCALYCICCPAYFRCWTIPVLHLNSLEARWHSYDHFASCIALSCIQTWIKWHHERAHGLLAEAEVPITDRWLICRDLYRSHRTPQAAPAWPMPAQDMPASQQQHRYGWMEQQTQRNMLYPPPSQIPPAHLAAVGNQNGSIVSGWPTAQTEKADRPPANYAARPHFVPP